MVLQDNAVLVNLQYSQWENSFLFVLFS